MIDLRTPFSKIRIGTPFRWDVFPVPRMSETFVKVSDTSAISSNTGERWLLRGPVPAGALVWPVTVTFQEQEERCEG